MKLPMLLAITLAVIAAPRPGAAKDVKAAKYSLEICRELPPDVNLSFPAAQVATIYSQLSLKFIWVDMSKCTPGTPEIDFAREYTNFERDALGMTFLDSQRIVVFLDRVKATAPRKFTDAILSYVIAHEIGHLLEACRRHSMSGVMKASWSMDEYWRMQRPAGLAFAPEDLLLMEEGLEQRAAAGAAGK